MNEAFPDNASFESEAHSDLLSIGTAFENNSITHSILPYENSLSGTFLNSLDFLLRYPKLHIIGEVILHEEIGLGVHPSVELENIKQVILDTKIIEQTKVELNQLFKQKEIIYQINQDLLPSIESISKGELNCAGFVGNISMIQKYNLKLITKNLIEHSNHHFTRYFIISNSPTFPERHQLPKTSIAITLKNSPGTLMKVFSTFALRDINICKVESRASIRSIRSNSAWEYTMIVDVDGAPKVEEKLERAIENLKEFASNVHVLGSYPRYFAKPTFDLAPVGL
ncbi:ACT-like protein [Neoconidiobolus thromboides FSU 785]|nr:ACT-like protein [Neoconidiobolus thromboides FSU 785]